MTVDSNFEFMKLGPVPWQRALKQIADKEKMWPEALSLALDAQLSFLEQHGHKRPQFLFSHVHACILKQATKLTKLCLQGKPLQDDFRNTSLKSSITSATYCACVHVGNLRTCGHELPGLFHLLVQRKHQAHTLQFQAQHTYMSQRAARSGTSRHASFIALIQSMLVSTLKWLQ